MIITLVGENTFAIAEAEHELAAKFKAEFGEHGVSRVDGESFGPSGLGELLQGASLFAAERLVILKDAGHNKALWEALADWAKRVPETTTLLLVEPSIDKRTRTYKVLRSHSDFREFGLLEDYKLAKWVESQAEVLGATISPTDARYLVDRTGRDQWRMKHELEKLANYGSSIEQRSIDALVEPSPEGTAFELLDAALGGRQGRLSELINNLKNEEDPYKLFGLLASQVHALAVVGAAGDRSADQIAKDSGIHPFVIRKTQSLTKSLGKTRIKQIVDDTALCDVQLKSTGADPWQLIANCLNKIAALRS